MCVYTCMHVCMCDCSIRNAQPFWLIMGKRKRFVIGTDCSGTDAPLYALRRTKPYLRKRMKIRHAWSCDKSHAARQFIMASLILLSRLWFWFRSDSDSDSRFDFQDAEVLILISRFRFWFQDSDSDFIMANHKPKEFFHDILNRKHSRLPKTHLYTAGFPCQSFSSLGKRLGTKDLQKIKKWKINITKNLAQKILA